MRPTITQLCDFSLPRFLLATILLLGIYHGVTRAQENSPSKVNTVESREYGFPRISTSLAIRSPLRFPEIRGPKIGLVLSGGAARGIAQIGVLQALEEAGIVPDLIIGTSIGSIVGGLYASGYSAADLENMIPEIDWAEVLTLGNQINREDFAVDQKVQSDRSVLTIRFDGLRPVLPTSVSNGQRLTNLLNRLVLQAPYHAINFDSLRIPFRAVATDLYSGNRVVLNTGALGDALRASTTIPVMYAPVVQNSMALVDGGLRSNIAVDLARDAGCELIIAVNTTSPMRSEHEIQNPLDALDQVLNVMMTQNNIEQLRLANFVIAPKVSQFGASDFLAADTLIQIGRASAEPVVERIRAWRDSVLLASVLRDSSRLVISAGTPVRIRFNEEGGGITPDSIMRYQDFVHLAGEYSSRDEIESLTWSIEPGETSTIHVTVSKRPVIQRLCIEGAGMLPREELDSLIIGFLPAPLSRDRVREFAENLLRRFRDEGYSLAEITSLDFDTLSQTLKLVVSEGRIGTVQVSGNIVTREHVILREFPLRTGDIFNIESAQRGISYISALNLFHQVHFDVPIRDTISTVRITVNERSNRYLQIGTLIDNERNAQILTEFRDANLFGAGTEASLQFFGGLRNQRGGIRYNSNKLFYTPLNLSLQADLDASEYYVYSAIPDLPSRRFERKQTSSYQRTLLGLRGGVGMYVQRFGFITAFARYDRQRIFGDGDVIPSQDLNILQLGVSSTIDTRDRNPLPSKGIFLHVQYSSAQRTFGSDISFTKISGIYDLFVSSPDRVWTFHPSLVFGYGDRTLPRSEFFHFGGLSNFIGLRENEYEGRQQFIGSMEIRALLPINIFFDTYAAMQYQLGQTLDMPEQISFSRLIHAVGFTLSINTPIGPAVFGVGRSFLLPEKNTRNPVRWSPAYLSFSIGMPFAP